MDVDESGRVLVAGEGDDDEGTSFPGLARLTPTGTFDKRFGRFTTHGPQDGTERFAVDGAGDECPGRFDHVRHLPADSRILVSGVCDGDAVLMRLLGDYTAPTGLTLQAPPYERPARARPRPGW